MTAADVAPPRAAATEPPRSLGTLPKAGLRQVTGGLGAYFRPGTHRSPLRHLGDRVLIDFPGAPTTVLTCSPDDARAMFTDKAGALSFGEVLRRFTPHGVLFGNDAFIFLEGQEHVSERRKIAPPFHGQALKRYEQAIADIAEQRLATWPTGEPVSFLKLGHQLALDVMMTVIFGVSERARMARLERAMIEYCAVSENPRFLAQLALAVAMGGRWLPVPGLDRKAAAVDAIVLEEMAERRRDPSAHRDDCLTLFVELLDAEDGPKDDLALARGMRGLMLAGYETTAVTLGWLAEMLVHHPETLAELEASVDRGDDAYVDAVVTEVMRLRPAVPATGRRALRDFDLNGVLLPRGAYVVISIMAVHERPDVYSDPLEFRPERFLDTRPGTYTWLPFGGGAHRCLGGAFSMFEARVLLRTLLRHRTLRAVDKRPERPLKSHPMLIPERGARVTLRKR